MRGRVLLVVEVEAESIDVAIALCSKSMALLVGIVLMYGIWDFS